MNINLKLLKANLPEQEKYLQGYTPGLFQAIQACHFETKSDQVNWSSFTLKEAEQALDMAVNYVDDESASDDDNFSTPPNEGNAVHEFLHNVEVIYQMKKNKPEKIGNDASFF